MRGDDLTRAVIELAQREFRNGIELPGFEEDVSYEVQGLGERELSIRVRIGEKPPRYFTVKVTDNI